MDYNFVNVDRFMELEKSGALLESGTYEGKDLVKSRSTTCVIAVIRLCDFSVFVWNFFLFLFALMWHTRHFSLASDSGETVLITLPVHTHKYASIHPSFGFVQTRVSSVMKEIARNLLNLRF